MGGRFVYQNVHLVNRSKIVILNALFLDIRCINLEKPHYTEYTN